MKKYLIVIISIIIDGLIPNITLFNFNNITYFSPICTGVSLIFLYNEDKKFYRLLIFAIVIYGGLYINNLILSTLLFGTIFIILKIFKRLFEDNLFTIIIQILLVISIWDLIFFLFHSILSTNVFIWNNYFYKLSHSLLFNIIYGIILFKINNKKVLKLNTK